MAEDDKDRQTQSAESLRRQIDELVGNKPETPKRPASLRDFIAEKTNQEEDKKEHPPTAPEE